MLECGVKIKYLVAAFVLLALVGCQDDDLPPPEIEVFSGELEFEKLGEAMSLRIDTVVFTVEGGQYRIDHTVNNTDLCNSGGRVADFGSNLLRLTPTFTDVNNCDSLHVPQGNFRSVFRGDSLYLGPNTQVFEWVDSTPPIIREYTDTMIYFFRLVQ